MAYEDAFGTLHMVTARILHSRLLGEGICESGVMEL